MKENVDIVTSVEHAVAKGHYDAVESMVNRSRWGMDDEFVVDDRTLAVQNVHALMVHIANSSQEGVQSVVYGARSGIFHAEVAIKASGDKIENKLKVFKPEMISEDQAVNYAGRLRDHLSTMLEREGTELPERAVEIASNLMQVLSSKFKVAVTGKGVEPVA